MNFAPHALDFYKVGHINQYPALTQYVYSNLTARSGKHSNVKGSKGVHWVGLQLVMKDYLIDEWNESFFKKPKKRVIDKFRRRVSYALGYEVDVSHMEALHDLGYLPIKIKALPEGAFVPYGIPMMTIVNTLPEFYWVTNMLESVLSAELWQMINSATTYSACKKLFEEYAKETCDNNEHVPYQGHDFSFRGMAGREAASKSAFAALACGSMGTDCVSSLDIAEDYYHAEGFVAGSVNATEHSVMCAGGKNDELETFRKLLTETYPTGILSIVSDTWDFWKVVTQTLPSLKQSILEREGQLVIRPDSGDPANIICGIKPEMNEYWYRGHPKECIKGLVECLWDTFGGTVNSKDYKVLNEKVGAIYGDSITPEVAKDILQRLESKGFASSNIVLGIGSYTNQYNTRDTHGMAIKATNVVIDGKSTPIFKDPKTDSGLKKSAKGLLMVTKTGSKYELKQECTIKEEKRGCLETVFLNGKVTKEVTLDELRENSK